jgi:hypothetical protein
MEKYTSFVIKKSDMKLMEQVRIHLAFNRGKVLSKIALFNLLLIEKAHQLSITVIEQPKSNGCSNE